MVPRLSQPQGHLQNVASSVITKVRSNRSMGIRTSGDQRPASASPSKHSSYGLGGYRTSPSQMLHELDPPSPLAGRSAADSSRGSPIRMLRTVPSDLSSRTSTSGLAASFADTSTLSFASSAPTSFAPGSTGTAGDTEPSAVSDPSSEPDSYQSRSHGASLTLPDLAFLFELAPHTVVEPLGQGTHERLLAPDWEDEEETRGGHVDAGLAEVTRITATTKAGDELGPVRGRFIIDQTAPLRILDRRTLAETQAAEASSLGRRPTKGALTTPSGGGAGAGLGSLLGSGLAGKGAGSSVGANGGALQPLENRADVKQSMDAESGDGSAKRKDGGHGHQHQHRHKDGHSLWEVVDPVALLGPLCD